MKVLLRSAITHYVHQQQHSTAQHSTAAVPDTVEEGIYYPDTLSAEDSQLQYLPGQKQQQLMIDPQAVSVVLSCPG
eukprot:scaffold911_cov162-Ochromonas_danica.AAC.24